MGAAACVNFPWCRSARFYSIAPQVRTTKNIEALSRRDRRHERFFVCSSLDSSARGIKLQRSNHFNCVSARHRINYGLLDFSVVIFSDGRRQRTSTARSISTDGQNGFSDAIHKAHHGVNAVKLSPSFPPLAGRTPRLRGNDEFGAALRR
jgi:hypothetical protein